MVETVEEVEEPEEERLDACVNLVRGEGPEKDSRERRLVELFDIFSEGI